MSSPVTLLYVPGDRGDRIPKALSSGADVVIVDLEDAVAPTAKIQARSTVVAALANISPDSPAVQVRINGSDTPWFADDCSAIADAAPSVEVRIPKVETAAQVETLAAALPGRKLHLLVETALGVENLFALAAAHSNVASLGLGELDLRSSTGISLEEGMDWIRTRLVIASRAAGLGAPTMSVFPKIRDDDGLLESSRRGKGLGFRGRCALHPRQLPVIREAFRPLPEEVTRAQELLARLDSSLDSGSGVALLSGGDFADAALVAAAQETLALHQRLAP